MKIELNHKEYIKEDINILRPASPKCTACAWLTLPSYYCSKFCRIGYIFKSATVKPSIFHL